MDNKFFSQEAILTNRLQRFVTRSKSTPFPISAATSSGAQSDEEKWNVAEHAQLVKWRKVLFLSHRRRRTGRGFLLWLQCLCDARAVKREQGNVLHCLTLAAQTVTNLV